MSDRVKYGEGPTEFGPGVNIELTGDEVATAIDAWLVARGVCVSGPRTISVNGELCKEGLVYVDPSGFVIHEGAKFSGRGPGPASTLTCSECGNDEIACFRYTEKIENRHSIKKVVDGVFYITSAITPTYETGEGYDDGEDAHFECSECSHRWPVPEGTNIEWSL